MRLRAEAAVRGDATYLITGGVRRPRAAGRGRLGRTRRPHLLLVGRRPPAVEPRCSWRCCARAGRDQCRWPADVGERRRTWLRVRMALARSAAAAAGSSTPPARSTTACSLSCRPGRFEAVLAPKVAGAWNLHRPDRRVAARLLRRCSRRWRRCSAPPDRPTTPRPTPSSTRWRTHAAPRACRRSASTGGLGEVGMAAAAGRRGRARSTAQGLGTDRRPSRAGDCSSALLRSAAPQVAVLPVDWRSVAAPRPRGAASAGCCARLPAAPRRGAARAPRAARLSHASWRPRAGAAARRCCAAACSEQVVRVLGLDRGRRIDRSQRAPRARPGLADGGRAAQPARRSARAGRCRRRWLSTIPTHRRALRLRSLATLPDAGARRSRSRRSRCCGGDGALPATSLEMTDAEARRSCAAELQTGGAAVSEPERRRCLPVKRALLEIRALQAPRRRSRGRRAEPIAIVGIGCRFPGGATTRGVLAPAPRRRRRDHRGARRPLGRRRVLRPEPRRAGKMYDALGRLPRAASTGSTRTSSASRRAKR